jgi:hypothetical protein
VVITFTVEGGKVLAMRQRDPSGEFVFPRSPLMLLSVDVEPFAPLLLTLTRRSYLGEVSTTRYHVPVLTSSKCSRTWTRSVPPAVAGGSTIAIILTSYPFALNTMI